MKSLLLITFLLFSGACFAQYKDTSVRDEKVILHLSKYDHQVKTGKGFFYSGLGIMLASSALLLVKEDAEEYAGAVGLIGGTFTTYGFFTLLDSRRHYNRAHMGNNTAIR